MTKKDIEMFKVLSDTDTGRWIVDYTERIIDELCDVRNLTDADDLSSIRKCIKFFEEKLINKMKLQNKKKEVDINPYE